MALGKAYGTKERVGTAANVALISLLAVVFVALANVFTAEMAKDKDVRWDLSQAKWYTLSASTKSYVRALDQEIEVYLVFGQDEAIRRAARNEVGAAQPDSGLLRDVYLPLIQRMTQQCRIAVGEAAQLNHRIAYFVADAGVAVDETRSWSKRTGVPGGEMVNHLVFFNPASKAVKSISFYKLFQVDLGGPRPGQHHVPPRLFGDVVEEGFVAGVRSVAGGPPRRVLVSEGHRETATDGAEGLLRSDGFAVGRINVDAVPEIGPDVDLLVIPTSEEPWPRVSRDKVQAFWKAGGRVLLFSGLTGREMFNDVLEGAGVKTQMTQISHGGAYRENLGPFALFGWDFLATPEHGSPHPAVASVAEARRPLYFGASRAFELSENYDKTAIKRTLLATTGPGAEAIPYVEDQGRLQRRPDLGVKNGSFPLMVLAERDRGADRKAGRLLAVTTDDWIDAEHLLQTAGLGNADLLRSTVHWLTDSDEFVASKPRTFQGAIAPLDRSKYEAFSIVTVWLIPILTILGGALVAIVRRRG